MSALRYFRPFSTAPMKVGRTLTWDPEKHQCKDDAEANKLLKRPYRQPWVHPGA